MKNKKKKGFTLVELIVVIAIIAILAAIAVPTTMVFVEKANISAETQEMNIMTDAQGIIQSAQGPASSHIDLDNAATMKTYIEANLTNIPKSLGAIQYTVTGTTDNWKVTVTLYSANYGAKEEGRISVELQQVFTDAQLGIATGATGKSLTYTTANWVDEKTGVGAAASTATWA